MARPKQHTISIEWDGEQVPITPADFGYSVTETEVERYLNSLDVNALSPTKQLEKALRARRAVDAYRLDIMRRYLDDVAAGKTAMSPTVLAVIAAIAPAYVDADRTAAEKAAAAKEKKKEQPAAQQDVPQPVPADDENNIDIDY